MPCSGKSTVAIKLAKKLGWPRYYMGRLFREAARKKGMTVEEYEIYGKKHPEADTDVDYYQKELGEKEDNFVIEGRTSFFFIPHSLKVFLDVDLDEAAKRIMHDKNKGKERNERVFETIEETKKNLILRNSSNQERYNKTYGIKDFLDKSQFDLVIDTTNISPDEVVSKILAEIKKKE